MRIISVTARNYRLHRDLTVEFDPSRNLIGGSNETGKSTLAEAMHRALFCRHRTGGELQQSMCSDIHNGKPEVKLVFEVGGRTWTLDKTLWLRLVPARRPPVDFRIERGVSCLVQVVGYHVGTRPARPIHIQYNTSNENELRHDDQIIHRIRRP